MNYQAVLSFWFDEITPAQQWAKDAAFDRQIGDRFLAVHEQANLGELYPWRMTAEGRLAEVIVLDQFSRNIFRDDPRAFASDALALILAQEAILHRLDQDLTARERGFLYMPFMHSESLKIHDLATDLFAKNGVQSTIDFERKHRAIIERFGRYPHRNAILQRASTEEERVFLSQPGSGF